MVKQVILYRALIKISMRFYPLQNLQVSLKVFWTLAKDRRLPCQRLFLTATAVVRVPTLVLVPRARRRHDACTCNGLCYRSRPLLLPSQLRKLKYFIMDRKHTWHRAAERPFIALDKLSILLLFPKGVALSILYTYYTKSLKSLE